ncbi:MAG: hypothetical protein KIT54_04255 [Phycisphaeraceae bacterium]|nr:hypothetical protein [Phycisphaeraceae bacterium]
MYMHLGRFAAAAAGLLAFAAVSHAQITGTDLGTGAPPAVLDGYTMQAGVDPRAVIADVTDAPIGGGRNVTFDRTMSHRRIGSGWGTWSHGYTGDVYFTGAGVNTVTLNFTAGQVGAFILYVEPNNFGLFEFEIVGRSGSGATSTFNRSIEGNAGARGFGFSAPAGGHIASVRVTNTGASSNGFAVGEFSSAPRRGCQEWTPFTFGDVGSMTTETLVVPAGCTKLKVTDAFLSGDRFRVRVLDGGSVVANFNTSVPTTTGASIGSDYDAAYADRRWSSNAVNLRPGTYRLEITVLDSPFGSGGAAYELEANPCGFGKCAADFNGDGTLNIFDFLAFQNAFASGNRCADIDGDGILTIFDFLAFQNLFATGC